MFKLALRLIWRDWRGGELRLLWMALILAISSLTSISLFTNRIEQSMTVESANLLAADLRLNSNYAISEKWKQQAQTLGLKQAHISGFQAMLFSPQEMQLASIKAVTKTYPLKGQLMVSKVPFSSGQETARGPTLGTIWLDSRLMASLAVKLGDLVDIGKTPLRVSQVLISEPDQVRGFAGFAPRAIMHMDDLDATGLIQPGSRIRHRWLLAGDSASLEQLQKQLADQLKAGQRWLTPRQGNTNLQASLEQAEQFLLLSGSLAVVLSGIALALAARRYALRQLNHVALLKCLGLKPAQLHLMYSLQLLLLAFMAMLVALPLGWLLHEGLLWLVVDYVQVSDAKIPWRPFALGTATGLLCLFAFIAPPLLSLIQVAPSQVCHQAHQANSTQPWWHTGLGLIAIISLVYWHSNSMTITLSLLAASLIVILFLLLLAWGLISASSHLRSHLPTQWQLGLARLQRHQWQNQIQIAIFALALMLLFSLISVRSFLLSDWQKQLTENTPNIFLLNIFDEQRLTLNKFMAQHDFQDTGLNYYPVSRGRLVNPDPQQLDQQANRHGGPPADRELNLTWSKLLPTNNTLVEGDWWQPNSKNLQVSLEVSYAMRFNLKVGDQLLFDVGGLEHIATITNLRAVDWSSLQPNFYYIFSKPITSAGSSTYLASFYLQIDKRPLLTQLLRQYPTVSVIDVDQLIQQIQKIIGQLTLAVESILLLILAAGLIVLVASVQATLDERLHESAIMRTIGASRQMIRKLIIIEYASLGAMAGLLAGLGAEALIMLLQTQVFNVPTSLHWPLWVMAPLFGMGLIGFTGWWSNRQVIVTPPLQILRKL